MKSPSIVIKIAPDYIGRFDSEATYTMVESMIYFDAVHPVLKALKRFGDRGDIPFPMVFQGVSRDVDVPRYLREENASRLGAKGAKYLASTTVGVKKTWDLSSVFPNSYESKGWDVLNKEPFPSTSPSIPLDKSQKEAIKLALSRGLAIIQGPPGKNIIVYLRLLRLYQWPVYFTVVVVMFD